MSFDRHVQIGRVAFIAYGPDEGKIVAILDVLDQNRALIDGPTVTRKQINFKALHLTRITFKIGRGVRHGKFMKAWEKAKIDKRWKESAWCKKIEAKKKRANIGDFDRFKLMKAKQSRNRLINIEFGKLRKDHHKAYIAKELKAKKSEEKKAVPKKSVGKKTRGKKVGAKKPKAAKK